VLATYRMPLPFKSANEGSKCVSMLMTGGKYEAGPATRVSSNKLTNVMDRALKVRRVLEYNMSSPMMLPAKWTRPLCSGAS